RRLAESCVGMLVLLGALVFQAAAHGSEDVPVGILTVPPGGATSIAIELSGPGDRVQWVWNASAPERLSMQFLWHDMAGREYALFPDGTRETFGMFVAPAEFGGARLVWRNAGAAPVEVEWTYHASAPFWRRPDMVLPTLIPIIFLAGAYPLGWAIDARRRARRR
ncbi:MAG TPA: hypothetical protein VGC99_00235, partial [Candidatus Tectomicrobia bacterium]